MKKRIQSVFAVILTMVTILAYTVPANAWVQWKSPSEVKGSDYTDYPAFAEALNAVFKGDIDLFSDKALKKEVSLPIGSKISMSTQYYIRSSSRNTTTSGWTCFIYANAAFNKLFGEFVGNAGALKNCYIALGKGTSKMTYNILKNAGIRPGAYIRTSPKSDGSYYGSDGHSMIILSYDDKYITYLEGNGDGYGLVRITKRTYSEFNSAQLSGKGRKVSHIVQPTEKWFNELYGNRPEYYTYTFSYNANGGSGSEKSFTVKYGNKFSLSSSNFSKKNSDFIGWQIKRNNDNKWLTDKGWCSENEITASNKKTTFKNGATLVLDDSFISETEGNVSYTAYAVWDEWIYETCTSVSLISNSSSRQFYPLDSTVSFEGSQIQFNFASGRSTRVTVNSTCNSDTPQIFSFNGFEYKFYIDSTVNTTGENPCYIRLDSFKGEFARITGNKIVKETELLSDPCNITGENATIKITYTDGTSETVASTEFVPTVCNQNSVTGSMWTSGGFTVNWSICVDIDDKNITVTYPSGLTKSTFKGDTNFDGKTNTSDLAAVKLALANSNDEFYYLYCAADFDCDNKISSSDLAAIKLFLAND